MEIDSLKKLIFCVLLYEAGIGIAVDSASEIILWIEKYYQKKKSKKNTFEKWLSTLEQTFHVELIPEVNLLHGIAYDYKIEYKNIAWSQEQETLQEQQSLILEQMLIFLQDSDLLDYLEKKAEKWNRKNSKPD